MRKRLMFYGYNLIITMIIVSLYHFISLYGVQKNLADDYKVGGVFAIEEE